MSIFLPPPLPFFSLSLSHFVCVDISIHLFIYSLTHRVLQVISLMSISEIYRIALHSKNLRSCIATFAYCILCKRILFSALTMSFCRTSRRFPLKSAWSRAERVHCSQSNLLVRPILDALPFFQNRVIIKERKNERRRLFIKFSYTFEGLFQTRIKGFPRSGESVVKVFSFCIGARPSG